MNNINKTDRTGADIRVLIVWYCQGRCKLISIKRASQMWARYRRSVGVF